MKKKAKAATTKSFRDRIVRQIVRAGQRAGLSSELLRKLRKLPDIVAAMGDGPKWDSLRKAAKLIVKGWGYDSGLMAQNTLKIFGACLEVELGVEFDRRAKKALKMQERMFSKAVKGLSKGDYLSPDVPLEVLEVKHRVLGGGPGIPVAETKRNPSTSFGRSGPRTLKKRALGKGARE